MKDLYWDPYDKEIDRDPYPVWRWMRDEAPVYSNEKLDFYVLSRHKDVNDAHLDPATFSSEHGSILEIMTPEPMNVGQMIFMDPPLHTTMRLLVSRAFTPRRVGGLDGVVRAIAAQLLDAQVGSGGFDYVQDFAALLPSMVISELIGVDPADREEVRHAIDETVYSDEGKGMINEISFAAQIKLHTYFTEQIEARRSAPRDDMMTALTQTEIRSGDGMRRLTTSEAADFTNLLVSDRNIPKTEVISRMIPAGRVGTPDDIGATAAFLCSDAAGYITGQIIAANGGAVL